MELKFPENVRIYMETCRPWTWYNAIFNLRQELQPDDHGAHKPSDGDCLHQMYQGNNQAMMLLVIHVEKVLH